MNGYINAVYGDPFDNGRFKNSKIKRINHMDLPIGMDDGRIGLYIMGSAYDRSVPKYVCILTVTKRPAVFKGQTLGYLQDIQ